MADNLADGGARMGEHAKNIHDEAGAAVSDTRGMMGEAATRVATKAKEYASQGYEYAADKSKQAKETAQGYIEDNPWYAVGIALGVGVLLGLLLRRGGGGE